MYLFIENIRQLSASRNRVICLHLFVGQLESCHAHWSFVSFFKALSEPSQEVLRISWCKSQAGKGCVRVLVQNLHLKPLDHPVKKLPYDTITLAGVGRLFTNPISLLFARVSPWWAAHKSVCIAPFRWL